MPRVTYLLKNTFVDILCSWVTTAKMKRIWDSPADLVLSRVGSLSRWISPSPPWMSPVRSWRIGEGHLEKEKRRGKLFSAHKVKFVFQSERQQMRSNWLKIIWGRITRANDRVKNLSGKRPPFMQIFQCGSQSNLKELIKVASANQRPHCLVVFYKDWRSICQSACLLFIVAALTGHSDPWEFTTLLRFLLGSVTSHRQTMVPGGLCSCTRLRLTDVMPVQSEVMLPCKSSCVNSKC